MKVWITRSEPGASRLARVLAVRGFEPIVAPMVGIEAMDVMPPTVASVCVVLSEHAARAAARVQSRLGFVAIGNRTADVLRALVPGTVTVPSRQDSAGIIRWLETHLDPMTDDPVVICTGEGGSEIVEQFLREQGWRYLRLNAYRRLPLAVTADVRLAGVIVLGSGEAVRRIAAVWKTCGGPADVLVVVPSARVAQMATQAGFARVRTADGASPEAILEALADVA